MNKLLFDLDITLLEENQIFGENRLDIFDKYGTKAAITDFAILLGGDATYYYISEENNLKDRTGWWWTKSSDSDNDVRVVTQIGRRNWDSADERSGGARPVIPYSSIIKESLNRKVNNLGVFEVEYGEYPQTIVNESLSNELEKLYKENKLQQTGKKYTTDSVSYYQSYTPFKERKHIEYEYNGEKYIRILGDYNFVGKQLSDGRLVEAGKPYFVKVEPIVWLIDEEKNKAVSKKLLFSGVQFCDKYDYEGDFNSTRIKWFLDTHFSKDIIPSNNKIKYYLINSNNINFLAYEKDEVLKELYLNIDLVPENANYYPEDALIYSYNEIKEITLEEVKNYIINTKKINYLKTVKDLCKYYNNEIFNDILREYNNEKTKKFISN